MSHRKPRALAAISGADLRNPQRYRDRPAGLGRAPLGDPPATMPADQQEAWHDFAANLPWLNRSHRAIVRLACITAARIEAATEPGVNLLSAYSSILSKLGATPVDDSRVSWAAEEVDETERFFQ